MLESSNTTISNVALAEYKRLAESDRITTQLTAKTALISSHNATIDQLENTIQDLKRDRKDYLPYVERQNQLKQQRKKYETDPAGLLAHLDRAD